MCLENTAPRATRTVAAPQMVLLAVLCLPRDPSLPPCATQDGSSARPWRVAAAGTPGGPRGAGSVGLGAACKAYRSRKSSSSFPSIVTASKEKLESQRSGLDGF